MRRLGHASRAAALIYQHAADERDSEIARALDAMLGQADGVGPVASIEAARRARKEGRKTGS